MLLVLSACGGNKYDKAIDEIIKQRKEYFEDRGDDASKITRENSIIRVFEDGKYIQHAYYLSDSPRKLSTYAYYEKVGDKYERMSKMPGSGEGDRLGLYKKKPDYEEVKGEEVD